MMSLYSKGVSKLSDTNLLTDEIVYPSVNELKNKINILRYKSNLTLIVIDRIERISSEERFTSTIKYKALESFIIEIKRLSLEINIPIVCSLTLSMEKERKKPQIYSDDLGVIENHADTIFALFKPDYYDLPDWKTEEGRPYYLKSLKNRHGSLDTISLLQNATTGKFSDEVYIP